MLDKISIIIADDHKIIRDGLKFFLSKIPEFKVVAEAKDGEELMKIVEEITPDVLLLDIAMPKMNGLEALKHLTDTNPNIKAIILSMHDEAEYIMKAIQHGAKGYLLKDTDEKELEMAIKTIASGGKYFNATVSNIMIENLSHKPNLKMTSEIHVSQREKEVLQLVAEGLSNKLIADKLSISIRTVETHRLNLLRKMEVTNTAELVKKAMENGLIS